MIAKKKICIGCNTEQYIFSKKCCRICWGRLYNKPIKKVSEKGKIKRLEKIEYTKNQFVFFLEIWSKRKHRCLNCDYYISEPLSYNFHHALEKSRYPKFALVEDNIILLCWQCHSQRHIDPSKTPIIINLENIIKLKLLE